MRSAFFASLLLVAGPLQAALIDNGLYTSDVAQGLDWLDLSQTAGMSAADALSSNAGWRYATNTEVESLFATAFDGYYDTVGPGYSGLSRISDGAYSDQIEDILNWQSLFGWTGQDRWSWGIYQDENDDWRWMGAFFDSESNNDVYGLDYSGNASGVAENGGYEQGVFLVRSSIVPIPAAVWLFGSALAGLGWLRRKQTT